jgi:long-chain acyl-CoA synthetase
MLRRLGFARMDAPALRTLTQAGGKLSADQVAYFARETRSRGIRFFVMYGQTEAGPRISYLPPQDAEANAGSIGRAIPGVRLTLKTADGSETDAPGAEGELICRSPAIMMGYAMERADLARGDEMGGLLATGDLARVNAAGYLEITGRASRFIKVMGTRVNLEDAEQAAKALGFTAAAIGRDDRLVIVLEGEPDQAAAREALVAALKVPPRALEVTARDALPRSASGKILYGELMREILGEGAPG